MFYRIEAHDVPEHVSGFWIFTRSLNNQNKVQQCSTTLLANLVQEHF